MTGRRVAVIGFGVTGRAVARALVGFGDDVEVADDRPPADADAVAAALGVGVRTTPAEADLEMWLSNFDLVVPSPGIPFDHPVYETAARAGVPVRAEIEVATQMRAPGTGAPIVAITGTNGKTTVTTMVTAILNASGRATVSAGNIGLPLIEAVFSPAQVIVAEVSSFQLQFTDRFRPWVSCWLNLAPDHLDWHPTPEHYAAAKSRIWSNQAAGDTAVYNGADPVVVAAAAAIPAGVERITFSTRGDGAYGARDEWIFGPGQKRLVRLNDLPRALPHDIANSHAAVAVARAAGATDEGCRQGLAQTRTLPHRVAFVGEAGEISWYDDSKATTPASVLAAVAGFGSVVLIAGGRNKGLDLGVLATTAPPVRAVVAIGDASAEVEDAFRGVVPVKTARSMAAAVDAAADMAHRGDAVLLSPGCASFDWYSSYAARGDEFVSIVHNRLTKWEDPC